MPIYNVEKYIERALLSALNQTYQNLEILIVDDLGHDNSMDIVYQLKSTHPRGNCIRIITHKKKSWFGRNKKHSN
ncbi:glycosyltransferase family 2 protein [Bacteroides sp. 2_2_4]|uniref:glycosyltransferase family 2 protein n=1 Tax=Bacteroides sp. 2_2_4 TaxID=469590 RepID=UPI00211002B0|nr:glycosyltransferase family A protein [Bacteroides sp. 2_2_4]MCS3252495.1 glycosyltransferase family 2 protein [Bacteroides ovatus]